MTLLDFYERVLETSGLEVMTLGSIKTSIKNCMADLTSRGYKNFQELSLSDSTLHKYKEYQENGLLIVNCPTDIRKTLYLKAYFPDNAVKATRYALTNPRVQCTKVDNLYLSVYPKNSCIFYLKNDKIYIEWDKELGELEDVFFGYYARLKAPDIPDDIGLTEDSLSQYNIPIREEFEDALVFYACYFYYARYLKDLDKMNFFLSQYKYYVEDIIHEISYEDDFYEEDSVIKVEDF